jgi:hypothetical protein
VDKGIRLFAGLTALLAMGSAQAVCPTSFVYTDINDATGHVFEVYKANGIAWDEAASCAAKPLGGAPGAVVGHLATITSSSENEWIIDDLLLPALGAAAPLGQSQVWVGGYQEPGFGEPGGGWRWLNSEGPFSGSNGNTDYTNWAASEPNNNGGSENHLTVGRYPDNLYAWNDEGSAPGSIGGYIVEYDTPRTSSDCVGTSTEACTTVEGQTLTFPAGSFDQTDGNIKFTAFEFDDPRVDEFGKCTVNRGPLTLFTDPAFGGNAELRIPEYLCGSPKFVVVKVDSEDLTILKGAVLVENETDTVLPDNLYKCSDPIFGNTDTDPLYSPDPQFQDVVVWQSTNPANMLEANPVFGGTGIYQGAATEATNGCGSTRAKVRGASYFVVGMHVDFNLGSDFPSNAAQNYQQFVALSRYKLTLLRKSIVAARSAGSLRPAVSSAMDALIALAIYRLDRGNPAGALIQVRQFLWLVNAANYTVVAGQNYNGDHLMRGENIAFTLRAKVIPYKPVP